MGRPINFNKIGGDTSQPGNQLQFVAWFDGQGSAETAWLEKQTGVSRFRLVAEADSDRRQLFYIGDGEPSEAGEAALKVLPFSEDTNAELSVDHLVVSDVEIATGGSDIDEIDGDYTVTVVGGTFDTAATLTATVTGGVVTAVTIAGAGEYVAAPTNPVSVTGLTSDVNTVLPTFNLQFGLGTVTVVDGGSGYTAAPSINVLTDDTLSVDPEFTVALTGTSIDTVTVDTAGAGFTVIPELLATFPEGSVEYVRSIQQHRVKTYEGNIYQYDVDTIAEFPGQVTIKIL